MSDPGSRARELFDAERYAEAEYILWEVIRTSPRAPMATYLLGLCLLFQGRLEEGRRLVDRAYELRLWLDDSVSSPGCVAVLHDCATTYPEWDWPVYQLARQRWRATDLDVHKAIEALVDDAGRPVSFVQIGANDGRSGDPLRDLILRYGMRGVFVEPQPEPFERLQDRYAGVDGLQFARIAITETDGPVTMYTDPNRTTLGTLTPDRNIMRNRTDSATSVEVDGRTFASLVRDFDLDQFDVLQLDTEGHDYTILRQVAIAEHGIQIVNLEYFCLPVSERRAAAELLERLGFAIFFTHMDLLAVKQARFEDQFCIVRTDA